MSENERFNSLALQVAILEKDLKNIAQEVNELTESLKSIVSLLTKLKWIGVGLIAGLLANAVDSPITYLIFKVVGIQ